MLAQPAFGRRLKALRLERGMSQVALAEGGMSTGYLSRLESGARPPTERAVEHLAKRLGVSLSAFAEEQAPSLSQVLAAVTSSDSDDDLIERLDEALRTSEKLDPALHWQALWLLARACEAQGKHEQEHGLLIELVELSDELNAIELRVRARTRLSRCARLLGDNAEARRYADEAYRHASQVPITDQAAVLHALISAEAESGRLVEAQAHADELRELTADRRGSMLVEALWAAATVRIRQGAYAQAQALLERALAELDSHEDLMLWVRLRLAAASLCLQITPALTDRAGTWLDEVALVIGLVGTELHKQQLISLKAHLAFDEGRTDDARVLCAQLDGLQLLLSFRDRLRFEVLRVRLRILDGDYDDGLQALQQLARQAEETLNIELAADIWRRVATILSDARGREATGTG